MMTTKLQNAVPTLSGAWPAEIIPVFPQDYADEEDYVQAMAQQLAAEQQTSVAPLVGSGATSGHLVLRFGARGKLPVELWPQRDRVDHRADVRVVGTSASFAVCTAAGSAVTLQPLSSAILAALGLAAEQIDPLEEPPSLLVGITVSELAAFAATLFPFTPSPQNEDFIAQRLACGDSHSKRLDFLQLAQFLGFSQATVLLMPAGALTPQPSPVRSSAARISSAPPDFFGDGDLSTGTAFLGFIRTVFEGHDRSFEKMLHDPGALAAHWAEH
eukprot:CAMPEP_0171796852 /NCGR_PEP_ID=MMETSP0991-20121206/69591_1 /TAXON_ID=483369 /ORGANISM="non described non described, Strain CCMP2098" /LENGTH=271 /DNA_ID=CAMNT_0012407771 /DNA_START=8 /DNA_END=820 /DNA_ORIENTATION=-